MAILKGKDILDKVRRKIKDASYGNYDEINEAQRYIAEQTSFWWLRKSNIVGAGLEPNTKEFSLNLSNVRTLEKVWIAAASTTSVGAIEGITLSSGNPVSIQITAHGLTTGRQVLPSDVGGTTELDDNIYRITKTDADNFTLDGTDGDDFSAWTSAGTLVKYDINDGIWTLMDEAQAQLFNKNVRANSDESYSVTSGVVTVSTTSADTNRSDVGWSYYLKSGDAPFSTFVVSPTPSYAYKIRVDYTRLPVEISEEVKPDIPTAYHDILINWASGLIMFMDDENPRRSLRGEKLILESERKVFKLVRDSAANRVGSIDRPPAAWKY